MTAYIELNGSDYIRQLAATYIAAVDDVAEGKVTYEGLDMYYNPGSVPKALRMPYLFYIYDFGDIHELYYPAAADSQTAPDMLQDIPECDKVHLSE